MKYIFLCYINITLVVIGQLLFRMGMKDKTIDSFITMIKAIFSPMILAGLSIYAFTSILWLYVLNKVPISQAYPIQALGFPAILILAKYLMNENIPANRWIGIVIILTGVFVAAR